MYGIEHVFNSIVQHKLRDEAYSVCEKYKLFDVLVELSLEDKREQEYLESYGKDFSFVLYDFYLSHGKLLTL